MTFGELLARMESSGVQASLHLRLDHPPGALSTELTNAIKDHKPMLQAMLAGDVLNGQWGSFQREVDALVASGSTRADGIRQAYLKRFAIDIGEVDPEPLSWLWGVDA